MRETEGRAPNTLDSKVIYFTKKKTLAQKVEMISSMIKFCYLKIEIEFQVKKF